MKYLFIELEVQNGEYEHTERVLHTTKANNIRFAAERYAATFYGELKTELYDGRWMFNGGEIAVTLVKVIQLTPEEYILLTDIFYCRNTP